MLAGSVAFALQPPSRRWRPEPVAAGAPRPSGSLTSPAIRALVAITFGMGVVFGATEVGVTATAQHLASAAAAAPVLALWGVGSVIGGLVATRLGGGAGTARGLVTLVAALALTHGALMSAPGA